MAIGGINISYQRVRHMWLHPENLPPPILSGFLVTSVPADPNTLKLHADTDQPEGTAWSVVVTGLEDPTAAQIKAGFDGLGDPAAGALTTTVDDTIIDHFISSLVPLTEYYSHMLQENAYGQSNIVREKVGVAPQ